MKGSAEGARGVRSGEAAARAAITTLGALLALLALAFGGCSGNPPAGSSAYREGALGNGAFLFACDDGMACAPYSGAAKDFPEAIATGSTFDVRFVEKDQQGNDLITNERRYQGTVTVGVPPYIGDSPQGGLAALAPGYGTVLVRDGSGVVVDYVSLMIVKPTGLIVYEANYDVKRGKEQLPRLSKVNLAASGTATYRVVAEYGGEPIAGSIPVTWTSSDPATVEVESYSKRVLNVRAKKSGTATITAEGAGLSKAIEVEVTQ